MAHGVSSMDFSLFPELGDEVAFRICETEFLRCNVLLQGGSSQTWCFCWFSHDPWFDTSTDKSKSAEINYHQSTLWIDLT